MRYNITYSLVAVVGCVEPCFLQRSQHMNILELSKQKTMSSARFANLTAEEKVILLESKDSTNTKDATNT